MRAAFVAISFFASATSAAYAAETVTYTYDAKGRVIRVVHSGGPASGTDKQYTYDKADNRKIVKVTGAP